MTPSEMEQAIKTLDARTMAIEHILPTLATRQDLRDDYAKLATKIDLRLTTEALQHEAGAASEDAKRHAVILNETTRDDIRLLAEKMATKGDLQQVRRETASNDDLQRLETATKAEFQRMEKTTKRDLQRRVVRNFDRRVVGRDPGSSRPPAERQDGHVELAQRLGRAR